MQTLAQANIEVYDKYRYKFLYKYMLKKQCKSITDLRTNTKECFEDLKKENKLYIFKDNQMVGVLLTPEEYEWLEEMARPELIPLPEDEITDEMRASFEEAKNTPLDQFVNL